ncbi:MAG TPA: mercuric reductase [Phycisphaeraceae bacterium]
MRKGEGVYNAVVIGAGAAGLVVAAGTAGLGGRVALIERHKMGGDCLNYGCVPSKALIASARRIQAIREGHRYGLLPMEPRFDFDQVFQRMRACRTRIEPNDSQQRFESLGVDVFRGQARFLSPYEVEVDGTRLRGVNFVIASGSRPTMPDIDGLDQVPYYTNETIFDQMHEPPKRLAVIGGGPVGCELGQVFQRLGVRVTIVQRASRLLPREDPDASACLLEALQQEGVEVRLNTQAARARMNAGGVTLSLVGAGDGQPAGELEADALLIAVGRTPNIESLNLDAAGVKAGPRGVIVNDYLQTTQPHLYAAGDVTGLFLFTHMADAQARVVVRNMLLPIRKTRLDRRAALWCTYTEPEVAHVGLNESEAQRLGVAYDVWTQSFDHLDRAIVAGQDRGFAKVLTARGKDAILGGTIVGPHAGELMHELALAIQHGIGLSRLAGTVHAYPTLSEICRKAADAYQRSRLTPRVQKVFAWLYHRARRRAEARMKP